jgi:uncharacterized membrane protein YkvI
MKSAKSAICNLPGLVLIIIVNLTWADTATYYGDIIDPEIPAFRVISTKQFGLTSMMIHILAVMIRTLRKVAFQSSSNPKIAG